MSTLKKAPNWAGLHGYWTEYREKCRWGQKSVKGFGHHSWLGPKVCISGICMRKCWSNTPRHGALTSSPHYLGTYVVWKLAKEDIIMIRVKTIRTEDCNLRRIAWQLPISRVRIPAPYFQSFDLCDFFIISDRRCQSHSLRESAAPLTTVPPVFRPRYQSDIAISSTTRRTAIIAVAVKANNVKMEDRLRESHSHCK